MNIRLISGFLVLFSLSLQAQIQDPRGVNQIWKTDTAIRSVELNEFLCLLPRDGIPPIDNPEFLTALQALEKGIPKEPVIAVVRNGEAKAYPLSILMYHEIVNDKVGGVPVAVTFCPLCNASIVFDRTLEVDGQPILLDFGVSGMLRYSDLVMWDRQTETWWQQLSGTALVGQLKGQELVVLGSEITSLENFVHAYPSGEVLYSKEDNSYGTSPYVHYDSTGKQPFLFREDIDKRLPPTEYVVNLYGQRIPRVYPLSILSQQHLIQDRYEGQEILLLHAPGMLSVMDEKEIKNSQDIGQVAAFDPEGVEFYWMDGKFYDRPSASTWNQQGQCIEGKRKGEVLKRLPYGTHFAFAWLHFYPQSEIYKP